MESGEVMRKMGRTELEEKIAKYQCELEKCKEEIEYLRRENDNVKSAAEMYRKEVESYQQQCIEINNLNVALDVMTKKYVRLRETAGMD